MNLNTPHSLHRPRQLFFLVFLFAALALYARLFAHALIDDTFITLVYARNLAWHGRWGFLPGEPMNTATSPLNVILLAAAARLAGDAVRAVWLLGGALWLGMLAALWSIGRRLFGRPAFFTGLAGGALLANPLLISTLGLESYLFILCFLVALACFLARRWRLLAAALGALCLARIDGVLAAAVFFWFVPGWRERLRFTLIFVAVLLPWHLYAWIALGSFFPETLFIKASQKSFGGYSFLTGLYCYFSQYPAATAISFLLLPAAPLGLRLRRPAPRRAAGVVALYGAAHFAGYSALRVPPYHWYYASTLACLILLAALGLAELYQTAAAQRRRAWLAALWVVAALPALLLAALIARQGSPVPASMPIHSNWTTRAQYEVIAADLARLVPPGQAVLCDCEIGTLAFDSGAALHNEFSDRALLMDVVERILKPHGLKRLFTRFNFFFRRVASAPGPLPYRLTWHPQGAPATAPVLAQWPLENAWMGRFVIVLEKK